MKEEALSALSITSTPNPFLAPPEKKQKIENNNNNNSNQGPFYSIHFIILLSNVLNNINYNYNINNNYNININFNYY